MADVAPEMTKEWPKVNGWVADPSKFCAGLPGSTSPMGQFDPLELTSDMSIYEIKRYRESEVTHGRVSMLAVLGYLVGESFHPFFGGVVTGPANTHLTQVQEVAPAFFTILTLGIGASEVYRALKGWKVADVSLCVCREFQCEGAYF
jgi:light-harvesting complex I chlorophyll a/b binding protein 1